jgi:hypothetical protein
MPTKVRGTSGWLQPEFEVAWKETPVKKRKKVVGKAVKPKSKPKGKKPVRGKR